MKMAVRNVANLVSDHDCSRIDGSGLMTCHVRSICVHTSLPMAELRHLLLSEDNLEGGMQVMLVRNHRSGGLVTDQEAVRIRNEWRRRGKRKARQSTSLSYSTGLI